MQKQEIEIAGYRVIQLSPTEFEAENPKQNLDFYFERNEDDEYEVFIFDSKIKHLDDKAKVDPLIANFQCETLEEAVRDAIEWKVIL